MGRFIPAVERGCRCVGVVLVVNLNSTHYNHNLRARGHHAASWNRSPVANASSSLQMQRTNFPTIRDDRECPQNTATPGSTGGRSSHGRRMMQLWAPGDNSTAAMEEVKGHQICVPTIQIYRVPNHPVSILLGRRPLAIASKPARIWPSTEQHSTAILLHLSLCLRENSV